MTSKYLQIHCEQGTAEDPNIRLVTIPKWGIGKVDLRIDREEPLYWVGVGLTHRAEVRPGQWENVDNGGLSFHCADEAQAHELERELSAAIRPDAANSAVTLRPGINFLDSALCS